MVIKPYVIQEDVTVRGDLYLKGSLVNVDLDDTELVGEYGYDNLAPLPPNQTGDDADHSAIGN